jgi:hypothetical protein
MADDFNESALRYHRMLPYGKIEVTPTKPLASQTRSRAWPTHPASPPPAK